MQNIRSFIRLTQFAFILNLLALSCGSEIDQSFCPGLSDCTSTEDLTTSSVTYSTLYSDDFDRADETPIAAPWNFILVGGDNIEVKANEVSPTETDATDPPGALHTTDITATNVRISVTVRIAGAGYNGEMRLYGRSQSNGDILNTYFCGVDPATNQLVIGKRNAGVTSPIVISTGAMTYDNGDVYTLTFTGEGTSLTCALSGSDSLSVSSSDSDFATGYAGLAAGESGNNVLFFDDFLVETGS